MDSKEEPSNAVSDGNLGLVMNLARSAKTKRSDHEESRSVKQKVCDKNNDQQKQKVCEKNSDPHDIKFWKADTMPQIVPPPGNGVSSHWYLGSDKHDLFVRQSTKLIFDEIWNDYPTMKSHPFVRIIAGAPGIGKSWSINFMLQRLVEERQNIWFHSPKQKTLTIIQFTEGNEMPDVCIKNDSCLKLEKPPEDTWFLYDAVGGKEGAIVTSTPGHFSVSYEYKPLRVPCIIFLSSDISINVLSSDISINVSGIRIMLIDTAHNYPTYWIPPWELEEILEVKSSLYKQFGGKESGTTQDDFTQFLHMMYGVWGGGTLGRIEEFFSLFVLRGLSGTKAEAEKRMREEMEQVASNIIKYGPSNNCIASLDYAHQTGNAENRRRSAASWLVHPAPHRRGQNRTTMFGNRATMFEEYSCAFCSPLAERLFLEELASAGNITPVCRQNRVLEALRRETSHSLKFCHKLFCAVPSRNIVFEQFYLAHFFLTKMKTHGRWYNYEERGEQEGRLPRFSPVQFEMKNGLEQLKALIIQCIQKGGNTLIHPEIGSTPGVGHMFMVFEDGRVYVLHDTISEPNSFDPVRLLEYKTTAKKAIEVALQEEATDDLFRHVVVSRSSIAYSEPFTSNKPPWEYKLGPPSISNYGSMDAVKERFWKMGLAFPEEIEEKIKGLLLDIATREISKSTWVLDIVFDSCY